MSTTPLDPAVVVATLADLQVDEGVRLKPYTDTRGNISIAIGRNLTGVGVSHAEAVTLCLTDIATAGAALDANWPWWRSLPQAQACVMLNLAFNMGAETLSQFVHFLAAMQAHDWAAAGAQLVSSDWYGEVGQRGPRMVARLLGNAT